MKHAKMTAKGLMLSVIGLMMLMTGCADLTTPDTGLGQTETERAICEGIGGALPTRSRSDTPQTRDEITRLYATFAATCPDQEGLIP
jgi:hypothetical protein